VSARAEYGHVGTPAATAGDGDNQLAVTAPYALLQQPTLGLPYTTGPPTQHNTIAQGSNSARPLVGLPYSVIPGTGATSMSYASPPGTTATFGTNISPRTAGNYANLSTRPDLSRANSQYIPMISPRQPPTTYQVGNMHSQYANANNRF